MGVAAACLCCNAIAAVVVSEHGGYTFGVDYDITGASWITILQPSDPGVPYDFDCHDDVTNEPATIQAIMPAEGLSGRVELMVREHDGREFGAEDVDQIVFNSVVRPSPLLHIMAFKIRGTLGTDPNTDNHVFEIDGDFSAGSLAAPFYVYTGLLADMTITGDVPEAAVLQIGTLEAPYSISIGGDFLGDMIFRNDP
jgi:hypothetical protein